MRCVTVTAGLLLAAVLTARSAAAQSPVQVHVGPSTPGMEFGAHINFLDLFGDSSRTYGGRFAKRHTDWLVGEVAYDRTSLEYEQRDSRVLVVNARFQSPSTRAGKRSFISVGVARAAGLSFEWSPMISAGAQAEAPNGVLAFRAELQVFTRGRAEAGPFERARLLTGVAIGIP